MRLIVALAALQHLHMSGVDVKTTFLYRELDEELFMEQPEGFKRKGHEHKVFHLGFVTGDTAGDFGSHRTCHPQHRTRGSGSQWR